MRVHHIELLCRDLRFQVANFCNRFGFSLYGTWNDQLMKKRKVVLKKSSIYFVFHQHNDIDCDYIDNIALEVDKIKDVCKNIDQSLIDVMPQMILENNLDENMRIVGKHPSVIEAALLKSPVGNIKHTILDKSNYKGSFLPGFLQADKNSFKDGENDNIYENLKNENLEETYDNIYSLDHITFAVKQGTSLNLMDWYKQNLGFTRCKVNKEEEKEGFTVMTSTEHGSKLGLRLTAMQYHFCSEETMEIPQKLYKKENDVKFVFGESLGEQGPNQVDTFLRENSGPGVQHIGLSTSDIFTSVKIWRNNDVPFINPPYLYYNEIEELIKKIKMSHLDDLLKDHGVLLDIEDSEKREAEMYLLQVFTKPIFDKETFFFELIQRHGATGFGAGNISALWRAIETYLRNDNRIGLNTSS